MQAVRHLLAQRHLAVLLCATTLLLKLLVPTGYMIGNDQGRLSIIVCSGTVPAPQPMAMHGDMSAHGAEHATDHGKSGDDGKAEMPCAFAGLSAAALGAIDPIQFAALMAFIVALGLVLAELPVAARPIWLQPPLRGPPATP